MIFIQNLRFKGGELTFQNRLKITELKRAYYDRNSSLRNVCFIMFSHSSITWGRVLDYKTADTYIYDIKPSNKDFGYIKL